MTDTPFRWGIIGLGSIAHKFATGLQAIPEAHLLAVASRSHDKAETFGERFGAGRRYGSYKELAADPDVDAVYIATPHSGHEADSILCLEAGKAVLCEKPFAINEAQAQRMVDSARKYDAFLLEAMWTRFLPLIREVVKRVHDGAIGELRMIQADFGFRAGFDPNARLFDPALGGGGLLDVGVYPISLASLLLGEPDRVTGLADIGQTGVDEQAGIVLGYPAGQIAVLSTGVRTNTLHEATLLGTSGSIRIHSPWWVPTRFTLHANGHADEVVEMSFKGNGYNYEAVEVATCVARGLKESPLLPLSETLSILRTMDNLRSQWGVKYPMD